MSKVLYQLEKVSKKFTSINEELELFSDLDFNIVEGESLAIIGSSGSGKSTLLHLLGGLDSPSSGNIYFDGKNLQSMSSNALADFRNISLGFVFQFHHLLPEFSTVENVAMQAIIAGIPRSIALKEAKEMLKKVGLEERMDYKVTSLSGGERQRAAIARAALLRPRVLLADEPTGNLDEATGATVGSLLLNLNNDLGMTLVVVTHNRELAASMGRSVELRSGVLYDTLF